MSITLMNDMKKTMQTNLKKREYNMILNIDNRQVVTDEGLAIEMVCKDINNYNMRLSLIKGLYTITQTENKNTYNTYILSPFDSNKIDVLKKQGYYKMLLHIIDYHFSGAWGGAIKELDINNWLEYISYKD